MHRNGLDPTLVREQVRRISAWEGIAAADRLGRFLEFTVDKVLQGQAGEIKEYTLGVEVCGRPASFDPRLESVVRNTASRLRSKLKEYYLTVGKDDPVEIELPKGAYVPEFRIREAVAEPAVTRVESPARRRPLSYIGSAVATAGILVALAVAFWPRSKVPAPVVRFELTAPSGESLASLANAGPAAPSPDGTKIAFLVGAGGRRQVVVRRIDSGTIETIPGLSEGMLFFWSPDSRSLALFAGGKLQVATLGGGTPRILCDAPAPRGGTWSEPGGILFSGQAPSGLFRIFPASGKPQVVTQLDTASGEINHSWPHFLPDGRHFLYTAVHNRPEESTVYAGNLDSPSSRKALIKTAGNVAYAPVSDSSGYLVYSAGGALVAQRFDPSRLETSGNPIPVEPSVGSYEFYSLSDFSVSPAGLLAYRPATPERMRRLVWVNRNGALQKQIPEEGIYRFPEISPDGKSIAVEIIDRAQKTGDLWLLSADGANRSRLTFDPRSDFCPIWSPGGARLAFSSQRSGAGDLYWKSAQPGSPDELLHSSRKSTVPVSWTADGRFLILQIREGGKGTDLYGLEIGKNQPPFPLLQTEFEELGGRVSSDGRWLAYYSNEPKGWSVYVEPFPSDLKPLPQDPGRRQRIEVAARGWEPRWRSDGRELVYLSGVDVMAAEVDLQPTFKVRRIKQLFSAKDYFHRGFGYAVSRDGQSFLFSAPASEEPPQTPPVTVVLNWTSRIPK